MKKAQLMITVCAWHEPRQFFLSGFVVTHGICQHCLETMMLGMAAHKIPDWFNALIDGGWTTHKDSGYWPYYTKWGDPFPDLPVLYRIEHCETCWRLIRSCSAATEPWEERFVGSLMECIECVPV